MRNSFLARRTAPFGLVIAAAIAPATWVACIASAPDIQRQTDDGTDGFVDLDAGVGDAPNQPPNVDPHAVVGATPSHGPFSGGQRVLVRGNGFGAKVRVWFGATEVTEIIPVDATKVQVVAPPAKRGPVDVVTQNGDDASTRRVLVSGYTYDALFASPNSGPISGGNEIRVVGESTAFDASTQVFIGDDACTTTTLISPTEVGCVVPKGLPGARSLRADTTGGTYVVLDGYTYEDSSDGFKGGLSGAPLSGSMRVLVYNNFTGDAVPGAVVIAGDDLATGLQGVADAGGVVSFSDPSLQGKRSVTVAAYCHSPITFVDVPVDTVTVYLDPILSPACGATGDPPGTGTKTTSTGSVYGELVWPYDQEFQRGAWDVPEPIGDEKVVAYFFAASGNPSAPFNLPSGGASITPLAPGTVGYGFSFSTIPGNRTFYVLAGIENRSTNPPRFTAYAMGVVKGVPVLPEERTEDVFVRMDSPLDLALTLEPQPPALGPKGPDRLATNVAIRLGNDGFAILPVSQKVPLLPFQGDLDFVGLPWLGGDLAGSTYYISGRAATGPSLTAPLSVVGSIQTTSTAFPVPLPDFVGLPTLVTPAINTAWDGTNLTSTFGAGGAPIDLTVYDIASQNGLHRWTIAVPGGGRAIRVPDLRAIEVMGTRLGLPPGPLTIGVYGAHIDGFDYAKLPYRQLRSAGMTAYSLDYASAHLD